MTDQPADELRRALEHLENALLDIAEISPDPYAKARALYALETLAVLSKHPEPSPHSQTSELLAALAERNIHSQGDLLRYEQAAWAEARPEPSPLPLLRVGDDPHQARAVLALPPSPAQPTTPSVEALAAAVEKLPAGLTTHSCWDDHTGLNDTHEDGSPCHNEATEFVRRADVLAALRATPATPAE